MTTPPEKLEQSIGHDCQTGCGNRADVVIVQLATGETDILCAACNVAMFTAVINQLAETITETVTADDPDAVRLATEAATAALAAD